MPSLATTDLSIHYEDSGSAGPAVLLVHGWPDDASTWDAVLPALAATHRVIVPTLRGFGATTFTNASAPRTGNSGILAMDMVALLDGLGIGRCAVVGHDWGSNIAEAMAVGWPDRIERIALMSTPPRLGGIATSPFWHAQRQWYHWFMATGRGARAVAADPKGFARIMWENWSPKGWFDEATFERVARAFENPDWVDVTLHSYRARWDEAAPDTRSVWLEDKVKSTKTLSLPALYVQGEVDGVNPPPVTKAVPDKFRGSFDYVLVPGVGHFPQREAPEKIASVLSAFLAAKT